MKDAFFKSSLFLLLALTAGTATASTNVTLLANPLPDAGSSLLRLAGAMVVVLALFFAGIWCFRNWQRLAVGRGPLSKLQILEVKALGNRQALYLVACEDQKLLLGSSPAGLATLCRLPGSPNASSNTENADDGASFDLSLQKVLSRQP